MSGRATGTREWAGSTVNVCTGCSHGCLYCYGRELALRFGRIARGEDWTVERTNPAASRYGRRRGVVMLPSTHDLTEATYGPLLDAALRLLEAGNRLLLVTKSTSPVAQFQRELLGRSPGARQRVEWRFTVGTLDDDLAALWEPGAPPPSWRLEVLRRTAADGWQTSLSAEPLLDPWTAGLDLVLTAAPHVTGTIWIGAARQLARRTAWCARAGGAALAGAIRLLRAHQTPVAIGWAARLLYDALPAATWRAVRFKDSYAAVLRRAGWHVDNGIAAPRGAILEPRPC